MSEHRTIEIDFELHKLIETNRQSFSETPNAVLRRLLGAGAPAPTAVPGGKSWTGLGVELPHGTELKMTYNNVRYDARIDDGFWLADGQRFKSPSGAASGVAVTKNGGRTKLDGWGYWNVKKPSSPDWVSLIELWRQAGSKMA